MTSFDEGWSIKRMKLQTTYLLVLFPFLLGIPHFYPWKADGLFYRPVATQVSGR